MPILRDPPTFNEGEDEYEAWKADVLMWSEVTDIPVEKVAVVVHLSLKGKARKASSELKSTELKKQDGLKTLLAKLDQIFLQDPNWKCFNAYLAFENLRRDPSAPFDDYLSEFDSRYHRLKECKAVLPDAVVACRLLKSCNLSDVYFQLALSTTSEMTFEAMRSTLKKLFTDSKNGNEGGGNLNADSGETHVQVKTEPAEALYGGAANRRGRGRGRQGRYDSGNWRRGYGRCFICDAEGHWARDCPKRKLNNEGSSHDRNNQEGFYGNDVPQHTLMASAVCEATTTPLNAETIGHILLDSGCSKTVCGIQWYESFLETLSEREVSMIKHEESSAVFKFGDGKFFKSRSCVSFPCMLNGEYVTISTDIVDCDIPLLFSRSSMKRAGMNINLVDDTAIVFGRRMKLSTTTSGHYTIPIYRPPTIERVA